MSYQKENEFGIIDPLLKPRILILTDIGNEPDDQQSLVRLLTYANEFDLEGLIPTTSMWQRNIIRRDLMEKVIEAYNGEPRNNLMKHTGDYFPTQEELLSLIKEGLPKYSMEGVGEGKDSEGSEWIIKVVDKDDPRPLWIPIWGGANCLAQALWKVRKNRNENELNKFTSKIRVYAIADQDHSSLWIRTTFPNLFYIGTPFYVPKGEVDLLFRQASDANHEKATWYGISGDRLTKKIRGGPRTELIDKKWIRYNVKRNHGSLGAVYPTPFFNMETDTPSYLNLIPNGLRTIQSPAFGGWGGRYELRQSVGEPRPLYTDSWDTVVVGDGPGEIKGDIPGIYYSNQATVWRWREAYQHDFAARMDWASTPDYDNANHPPRVIVQGNLDRNVQGTDILELNASKSSDPDGNKLFFHWFHYKEAGSYEGKVNISNPFKAITKVLFENPKVWGLVHLILEVKDDGVPCLHRYARFILNVRN